MRKSVLFPVLIGTVLVMIALVLTSIMVLHHKNVEEPTHEYVSIRITDKYKNDGYAGFYIYKDTEYIVVGTYIDNENIEHTVTTFTNVNFYNSLNIGDATYYCLNHNKLKYYET